MKNENEKVTEFKLLAYLLLFVVVRGSKHI